MSLQQFRQLIGLQRSSGLTAINDRRNRGGGDNLNQQTTSNIRLINAFKQQENKKQWSQDINMNNSILQQQIFPRQHLSRRF
jgi:hypothetical protein